MYILKVMNSKDSKKCKQCGGELSNNDNIFCNKSCSAKYNNPIHRKKEDKHCLTCGSVLINRSSKYCNNTCQQKYETEQTLLEIENGTFVCDNTYTKNRWYKRYLILKHGEKCMKCGWNERNIHSDTIPIELEHKDGNSENVELTNLELLCPNCHSLSPTFRALNIGNGRYNRKERYKKGKSY